MKYLFCFMIFGLFYSSDAQSVLFNQPYVTMAEDFKIDSNKLNQYKKEGKLFVYNEDKHKTQLSRMLFKIKVGKNKKIDKGFYRLNYHVLSKQKLMHHRVRYIFIDQTKFESDQDYKSYLNTIRNLTKNNAFKSVAMQYSMDYYKNMGGDSGWFKQGTTHPTFFKEVTHSTRLADEIFEFEIPEIKGYYFVKKTTPKKAINEVLVLQIKEKK